MNPHELRQFGCDQFIKKHNENHPYAVNAVEFLTMEKGEDFTINAYITEQRKPGIVLDHYPVINCLLNALNVDMVNITRDNISVVTANLDWTTRSYENPPLIIGYHSQHYQSYVPKFDYDPYFDGFKKPVLSVADYSGQSKTSEKVCMFG